MFEPTLFGILPPQFWSIFLDLLAPMLAFMFLFLLGLPLKEIPFVKGLTNYDPPEYVLPIFALGTLFLSSFIFGTLFFLRTWTEQVDEPSFEKSFQIIRTLDIHNSDIYASGIRLDHYDGLSNFNIIVNGYRIFSTESNCSLNYQCLNIMQQDRSDLDHIESDVETVNQKIKKIPKLYGGPGFTSVRYIRERFTLPHTVPINHFLIKDLNFIDIHSWNSAEGSGCRLGLTLELKNQDGLVNAFAIEIDQNPIDGKILDSDILKSREVFYPRGQGPLELTPYGTSRAYHLWRVCERIRIAFNLTETQAQNVSSEPDFKTWALNRNKTALCSLLLGARPFCASLETSNLIENEHRLIGNDRQ